MSDLRKKQNWQVTISLQEVMGDETATSIPWYTPNDVAEFIRGILIRAGEIRDLKVEKVEAEAIGFIYI